MAKKNKRNKVNNNASTIPNKMPVKAPKKLQGLFNRAGIDLNPELENKLNPDQSDELQGLIEKLEQSNLKNEQSELEIVNKQEELNQSLADFLIRDKELSQQISEIGGKTKDVENRTTVLLKREAESLKSEEELLEREANAKAGFVLERKSSFMKTRDSLDKIEEEVDKLELEKNRLAVENIAKQRQQKIDFDRNLKESLSSEIELINLENDKLGRLQQELKAERIELNILKQKLNVKLNQQQLTTQQLRDELANEFQSAEQQQTQEIESLKKFRNRDLDKIKRLQDKISGYGELEREATLREFVQPSDVLEHLDNVEQELKDARSKLKGRSETDLEDDLEHFKGLAEEKSESLERIRQDLDEAQDKARKNMLSIREKLELQKKNDVLELHNKTLEVSIDSLKMTLDDLIEKQQSQEAFKELLKMDRQFSEPNAATAITSLEEFTQDLQNRIALAETDTVLYYSIRDIRKFVAGLAMSQLHVFEGISGTGKTSLVKAFAKAVGGHVTTVPVQAGWRDRDDLVGHYNAFEKRYYEKECLQGIYRAHTPSYKKRFNIILLDEMNLSRPEQYFAEFLSALEMREGERNVVLMDSSSSNTPKYFVEGRKIPLANNTWFMGTANHDETTFEFADKTHDRSFMMELKRQNRPDNWQPQNVNKDPIDIDSVKILFKKAEHNHRQEISALLTKLKDSNFSQLLERDFKIGWGNRFDVQAHRFISVYIACGGEANEALEHLLITRVLRKGKVLGRFDISQTKLENLNASLEKLLGNDCFESTEILLTETESKAEGVS